MKPSSSISKKEVFNVTAIPVLIASLCCFAPVAFAASLSDLLYFFRVAM